VVLTQVFQPLLLAVNRSIRTSYEIASPFVEVVAILGIVAFPLFYLVWTYVFPQPYESLTLRLMGSAILVPLAFRKRWPERLEPFLPLYWQFISLFALVFFFAYFLLMNYLSIVWVLSMIAAIFLLTFFVHWTSAIILFVTGTILAWLWYRATSPPEISLGSYLQYLVIYVFPLSFGGIINHRLHQYRRAQASFEKRLRQLSELNSKIIEEQNELLGRFLSNSIIARLRRYQHLYGLDDAISRMTSQRKRFCGIMQADIRNFTKMFGYDSEVDVAKLVSQCFREITEIGQDIAVLKPVGDCIFLYSDDEFGEDNAVRNILSLAVVFVDAVERINAQIVERGEQPLNFGIGVHAGEVIYGNLASDTMIDPTVIGVNVNKTARLEELTKAPAIQTLAGKNAIVLSKEIKSLLSDFIQQSSLTSVDLDAINVTMRDFERDRKVYVLPSAAAREYHQKAISHIQLQRSNPLIAYGKVNKHSHRGTRYYYEMQGTGANTAWTMLIDVSAYPAKQVARYASQHLADLDYQVNEMDGRWLVLSTAGMAGAFDEIAVEQRIVEVIDGLNRPAQR
jgi:class 3 adenylate cyclase